MNSIEILITKERIVKLVTVGDKVSQDLVDNSIKPDIMIVDNKIMRNEIKPISATADNVFYVKNPPGTITDEAWNAIHHAANHPERSKIIVKGEEDLLALVAILALPNNSLVLYGQPNQGLVAVKTTSEMKQKVKSIIESMKRN